MNESEIKAKLIATETPSWQRNAKYYLEDKFESDYSICSDPNWNGYNIPTKALGKGPIRIHELPLDHWLNMMPEGVDEDDCAECVQAEWVKARDEYAAYALDDRLTRDAREAAEDVERQDAFAAKQAVIQEKNWRALVDACCFAAGDPWDIDALSLWTQTVHWHHQHSLHENNTSEWAQVLHDAIDNGHERIDALRQVATGAARQSLMGHGIASIMIRQGVADPIGEAFIEAMTTKGVGADGKPRDTMNERKARRLYDRIRAGAAQAVAIQFGTSVPDGATMEDAYELLKGTLAAMRQLTVIEDVVISQDETQYGYDLNDIVAAPDRVQYLTGLVEAGAISLLLGRWGSYKTFVAIAWGLIGASGGRWDDEHGATQAVPVVYVAAEDAAGVRARALVYAAAMGLTVAPGMFSVYHRPVKLGNAEQVAELKAYVQAKGAKIVIYDTLHKVIAGMAESNDTAGLAYSVMDDIAAQTGAGSLVLHHTGYSGQHARNGSAFEDDAAYVFLLDFRGEDRKITNPRSFEILKTKNGASPEAVQLALRVVSKTEAWVGPHCAPSAVDVLVEELDAAGEPIDLGEAGITKWAAGRGLTVSVRAARTAAKIRKDRAGIVPPDYVMSVNRKRSTERAADCSKPDCSSESVMRGLCWHHAKPATE